MIQTHSDQLVEDTREALQNVRRALIELYAACGVDHGQPVEVAKRIGFHKNMAWRISRVITATDPFAALAHLPGNSGLEIALEAFSKFGAPPGAVEAVRGALRDLDNVVVRHAGDRAHLELILDSMGLLGAENQLEGSREMFYRGASGLWGVHAKTRLQSCFLMPSRKDSSRHDVVMVGGLLGFRRLRPTATWRLFKSQLHDDRGQPMNGQPFIERFEMSNGEDPPHVVRRFCSPNMPRLETAPSGDNRIEHLLPGGPVGNLGAFDCVIANIVRDLPARAAPGNEYASFAASESLPVEQLIFDLIVHRSITDADHPEVSVFGFPHGGPDDPGAQRQQNLLPVSGTFTELAGSPPAVATPLVPRYTEIMLAVFERMGMKPGEFRGRRMVLKYPPMSSMVVAKWKLP